MTQIVGLLGYPITHSISPVFQQAAFDHCSINVSYRKWPTAEEHLKASIERLRGDDYLGANVTIPYKEMIAELVDEVDEVANRLGAVNTIIKEGSRLVGRNTDEYGFMRSLRDKAMFDPKDKTIVLLGAGGAARAAAFGLIQAGVGSLTIANRSQERLERLVNELRHSNQFIQAISIESDEVKKVCESADLIVNATSIGMRHGSDEDRSPIMASAIASHTLVYDMVYTPSHTPLLSHALQAGAKTLGGLAMLVFQGAASFEMWTGKTAPVDVMLRAADEAMAAENT